MIREIRNFSLPNLIWILIVRISVITPIYSQEYEKSKSIWIEQGLVQGRIYKFEQKHMQLFRGIPYAEPPIGELRFKKPVKRGRWHRELEALDYGPPCIQFMDFHQNDKFASDNMKRQSEDCLFLNVFAPYDPEDETKLHPVIVWIHGGSFLAGSANTGLDLQVTVKNIIFKGIVLVTINYRLGPLGFMANWNSDIGAWEGNYGLWDQVMALEWIQANIKQFNGDPGKVTVMGESAGAASASVLALSPRTQGLLHQAIIMSGSSVAGWAIHRHGKPAWDISNIASYLRCEKQFNPVDVEEILKANPDTSLYKLSESGRYTDEEYDEEGNEKKKCNLQDRAPECLQDEDISAAQLLDCFRNELNFTSFIFRKGLTVELGVSKLIQDGDLIPLSGQEFVRNFSRLPIMTGIARREWAHKKPLFYNYKNYENLSESHMMNRIRAVIDSSYHKTVEKRLPNATLNLIANATYFRYLTSREQNDSNSWQLGAFIRVLQDLEADIEFVAPCQQEIDAYSENGVPVFAYTFDFVPRSPLIEQEHKRYDIFGYFADLDFTKKLTFNDAFHGLDHAFIFTNGYTSNYQIEPFTNRDRNMSRILSNMIVNFAKSGNPTPVPFSKRFDWPVYTQTERKYAKLDVPPIELNGQLQWPTPAFWNDHIQHLNRYTYREGDDAMKELDGRVALSAEERLQLNAYRRAWWALWLLVTALAIVLWLAIICIIVKKCTSPRTKPYDNIVVAR